MTKQYTLTNYRAKYIGKKRLCLTPGKIYDVHNIRHNSRLLGVFDESNDWYAYPKSLFEVVKEPKEEES